MNFNQGLKMKENDEIKTRSTPVAMVAPELKQNTDVDREISKTCAVLGCEESKNLNPDSFFPFPEDDNLRQIWTDLTGRSNWTPTDFSYICVQHFSVDCFECNADNNVVLVSKAVPSLKLPKHVLEVEYIEDEAFDNDTEDDEEMEYERLEDFDEIMADTNETEQKLTNGLNINREGRMKTVPDKVETLRLFTEVQKMQKTAVVLKNKLKSTLKIYRRQSRALLKLKEVIKVKRAILNQKQKKKARILLSLQEKIQEDTNGLVLAMPTKHTDDLKNFALSIYKYSPQAYIYIRNSLRTLLPSTDVLETWIAAGCEPKNMLTKSNMVKVVSELTESDLICRVTLQ
ncbi:THAP domain-containing protein 1-like [Aricia agestis]|uniref:THAP domain-containing protein 1-like n=1 Tax=Aricia agestis TaxID=91739 RepID=UPI001C20A847|nr:THAP domain-containing protein 1-like [Aricia agestis]